MVETAPRGDVPAAGAFDAVVLAGGAGRRLGGADKPSVVVAGLPLVDHVLHAVRSARCVVLVARPELARPGVLTTLEEPPGGGPVAGLAAGVDLLERAAPADDGLVVVLACDVPAAGAALPALLAAVVAGVDGARLVDRDGRPQHLVAVYRRAALHRALAGVVEVRGAALRTLVAGLSLVDVPDPDGSGADADTWADVARLDRVLPRQTPDEPRDVPS